MKELSPEEIEAIRKEIREETSKDKNKKKFIMMYEFECTDAKTDIEKILKICRISNSMKNFK